MGLRISKLAASLIFLLTALYLFVQQGSAGDARSWPMLVSAVPLALVGVFLLTRKVSPFDLFRSMVAGVVGYLVLRYGGSAGLALIDAIHSQQGGDILSSAIGLTGTLLVIIVTYWALWARSGVRRVLENIFSVQELLGKLVFTLSLLAIYRIGFHVPLPGLNQEALTELAKSQQQGIFGQAMSYFSMFTGGTLSRSTLFGLGIMPYISASIIFMLLGNVIPALEKLRKEGPSGQKKIQEYTRYATVGLCIVQGIFYMRWMMTAQLPGGDTIMYPAWQGSVLVFLIGVAGLTAGTIFLMWLGEQIDEYGIGNGISLLIMAGIVVRLPVAIQELFAKATFSLSAPAEGQIALPQMIFLAASFVFVVAGAILITQGQRRIPIQQAKQTRGRRVYGGQRHYLPLRVNHGGVMPIIFASSLMIFPNIIFGWLQSWVSKTWAPRGWGYETMTFLANAFQMGTWTHTVFYIGLIFFFAFFWTTVNFRPKDMADQLRDMGHFIPGLRPGKRTADYLERVMERITYCGAAFLAAIAVIPNVIYSEMKIPFQISQFLGGTGLLIMISVTLDLVQRIEANLVMRNYGGFLGGSTRIKGAQ